MDWCDVGRFRSALLLCYLTLFGLLHSSDSACVNKNDFECRGNSSFCIPRQQWQDGNADCPDSSDEECLEWQFDCKFGKPKCINLYNLHDGVIDCSSGFDEDCAAHFFVCMDRSDCIDPSRYIDGTMDCKDGSDEPCPSAHFLCEDRSECVHVSMFQDGTPDCRDASDEACTAFQFECLCGEPRCVGVEKYRDGVSDCADGSDEFDGDIFIDLDVYRCPHTGAAPRNETIRIPQPPPGAPMVPCGPGDANLCDEDLGEMCLIIAGAPRCLCGMGRIRVAGSRECVLPPPTPAPVAVLDQHDPTTPPPTRPTTTRKPSTSRRPTTRRAVRTTTRERLAQTTRTTAAPNLPVKKQDPKEESVTRVIGECDPNRGPDACPGEDEICREAGGGFYACVCRTNFIRDQRGTCIEMVNECLAPRNLTNECDRNAVCMDNPVSYECLCREGFIDMSIDPTVNPGRKCLPLVNECVSGAADCDGQAECLDLPGGFTCRCQLGFHDISPDKARRPGRVCSAQQLESPCANPSTNGCSDLAICRELGVEPFYTCVCPIGSVDLSPKPVSEPGRDCALLVNECVEGNDDCSRNGVCTDTPEGFFCRCRDGSVDLDPANPGRDCSEGSNPCANPTLNDCHSEAICDSNREGFFTCECPPGFIDLSPNQNRFPGRFCQKEVDECALGTHRCDPNADCLDTPEAYGCRCRSGFVAVRDPANPSNLQPTMCQRSAGCDAALCSPNAQCRDSEAGPVCQCHRGFIDLSLELGGSDFGRVCEPLRNECLDGSHDCSPNANCIDSPEGFLCRCRDGYSDGSPDVSRPGRLCSRAFTPQPPECDVNDPLSCGLGLRLETCTFVNATYKCLCPPGISRLPDGTCRARNECAESRLNDCGHNSQCIDKPDGFTCQCELGFADVSTDKTNKPGRICRLLANECLQPRIFGVDCHKHSVCVDTEDSFTCRCNPGFADISQDLSSLPGRHCVPAINECLDNSMNDCSHNAICEDAKVGFTCRCRDGYLDTSRNVTSYPGRNCVKPKNTDNSSPTTPNPFNLDSCDPLRPRCGQGEVCVEDGISGRHICQCQPGARRWVDGRCRVFEACSESQANDCDPNSICSNVFDNFQCQCRPGYLDVSPNPLLAPGRVCKELINECAEQTTNDCSPFAECIDTRDSYYCICGDGYLDVSSESDLGVGRICVNASNECAHRSLHTCDDSADCVDLPRGYACQCAPGFVDVSASANLPNGRVCTVQTACPKQKTDLMFLIDGSGSIGSFIFKNEVLRFVREFVELFDIGTDKTRVAAIQYSDQIRHEFDLNQFADQSGVLEGIRSINYLTGLTRTGSALEHMTTEGFSLRRGARPLSDDDVSRVTIVITDGRSQDNVTIPAEKARRAGIQIFAIGVTDHVLKSELESISGSRQRYFHVNDFTDLDMRLRSLIQKEACPVGPQTPGPPGPCDPETHEGCNRALNEICANENGALRCGCPEPFQRNPRTGVCGGQPCNPDLRTSCRWPDVCRLTPHKNTRCACAAGYWRHYQTGDCVNGRTPLPQGNCEVGVVDSCPENQICRRGEGGRNTCVCSVGLQRNSKTDECVIPGSCDPSDPEACDARKREACLPHFTGEFSSCQCPPRHRRHSVTGVCLLNECETNTHDCDPFARCTDTDDGFLCSCTNGFQDLSPESNRRPGRHCVQFHHDECFMGNHNCSNNADCFDTESGHVCQCKRDFVDLSNNLRQIPGQVCEPLQDECSQRNLNTCHRDATCIDTISSYKCFCNPGFIDEDELVNPGRRCVKENVNDRCLPGNNDCSRNAQCSARGDDDYSCLCPQGFKDKSADPLGAPGRVCLPVFPECDNAAWNDCDTPRADCFEKDDGYTCRCKVGFLDISPNVAAEPGRLCKSLVDECSLGNHDCAINGGVCQDTPDSFDCLCDAGWLDVSPDPVRRPGRHCKPLDDECARGAHDCSPNADCTDTQDSFLCTCKTGFADVSTDRVVKPGRRCLLPVDECKENRHDCSPNAKCVDTLEAFRCGCLPDFDDKSPDPRERPGRICRPHFVDECNLGNHDCHTHAVCLDRDEGFTCRCEEGHLDQSPNRITRPGRLCVLKHVEPPPECLVQIRDSCDSNLKEVCRLVGGKPKCGCPENYSRNPSTNACTVINECLFPQLHDCSRNAVCRDTIDSFTCACAERFRDESPDPRNKPGRFCRELLNECLFDHLNDCHRRAVCEDLDEGFTCACGDGFRDVSPNPRAKPGRLCTRIEDECADPDLNSCDPNADCTDELEGYRCNCRENFIDISPTVGAPGRACRQIENECLSSSTNDCDPIATCTDTLESYSCECPPRSKDISPNAAFPGRVCQKLLNECREGTADCDRDGAICRDTEDSYICECKRGTIDRSRNPLTKPGRVCVKLTDECADGSADCHANAECRDLETGYACECKVGYRDTSTSQPGRSCTKPVNCPSDHDCALAAQCEPLGGGAYQCACLLGYVDRSPGQLKGRVCVRDNECRDPRLNDCSRNAVCYDLPEGYRCECVSPYLDRSPDKIGKPGRICEPPPPPPTPPKHPCQDPRGNDCSLLGTCRSTGATTYTCECPQGFADRSPDTRTKPGRVCVPQPRECSDPTLNDCHTFAFCDQVDDSRKFTCRCRDGYVDKSPNPRSKPGRNCVLTPNECLDASLNNCDPQALCRNTEEGYTCICPVNSLDLSDDKQRFPGRVCVTIENECRTFQRNNCSLFADCFDEDIGYTCRCKQGYIDTNPAEQGRNCILDHNECEATNLNDCHRNAECRDLRIGFECRCPPSFRDESPDRRRKPGRICVRNECDDPTSNECHPDAVCQDTEDSYVCHCKEGFVDNSPDLRKPGRRCTRVSLVATTPRPTPRPGGMVCGRLTCFLTLNEVCVGGLRCDCRPGQGRRQPGEPCVGVTPIELSLRVMRRNIVPLFWSSAYGQPDAGSYIEITDTFDRGVAQAVSNTPLASQFVYARTKFIDPPRLYNASWDQGLIFNFTCFVTSPNVRQKELWDQLMLSIRRTANSVGGTELFIDPLYDPFTPVRPSGDACGAGFCNPDLGELCVADRLCTCPHGQGRKSETDRCIEVEPFVLPLWVVRFGPRENLVYNGSFESPQSPLYQSFVERFKSGVSEAYSQTQLWPNFVRADVNDIQDPTNVNGTWAHGILFNFTTYFVRGRVRSPSDVWRAVVSSCLQNNYQLGNSQLFISPYQQDPFSPCFKSDCHPRSQCLVRGPNSYSCACASGFRDLNPSYPGRKCLSYNNTNECVEPGLNECTENSRCVDDAWLYHCECNPGFVDASPKDAPKESFCVIDYCRDVDFCPSNTTCVNLLERGRCDCLDGFTDIRQSARLEALGLSEHWCMRTEDVNECELGTTNCSRAATCTDLLFGYECACPHGLNGPGLPGRICAGALCPSCNFHGDCVHDEATSNTTCQCYDGWSGESCGVAALAFGDVRWILVIIFAILFLLLTLCCLCYFCTKCACFEGRGLWYREPLFTYRKGVWPWNTLEASTSSESGAEFSGMSSALGKNSDYYPDMAIPRAKLAKREGVETVDAAQLHGFLDSAVAIPRPRLRQSRGSSVDRSESEIFSDVHQGIRRRGAAESDTTSTSSSDYTLQEEYERRVVTDVTKRETNKTVTAHVHPSQAAAALADSSPNSALTAFAAANKRQRTGEGMLGDRRWARIAAEAAYVAAHSQESLREQKEIYESGRYTGGIGTATSERERGESVVDVDVAQLGSSDWLDSASTVHSQPRGLSEYSVGGDLASISEESRSVGESENAGEDMFDKKVSVKKTRDWAPSARGGGGTSRHSTTVTTKTVSKETKTH